MSLPVSYDDQGLIDFMATKISGFARLLAIVNPDDYQEPLNEVLMAYGVSSLALATDMAKLRTLATWQAWELATEKAAAQIDRTIGPDTRRFSTLFKNADTQRLRWALLARRYNALFKIRVYNISRSDDPYVIARTAGDELAP